MTSNCLDFTDNYVRSMPKGRDPRFAELDRLIAKMPPEPKPRVRRKILNTGSCLDCEQPTQSYHSDYCPKCRKDRRKAAHAELMRKWTQAHPEYFADYRRRERAEKRATAIMEAGR